MRLLFGLVLCLSMNVVAQSPAVVNIGPVLSFNNRRETITKIVGNYGGNYIALRGSASLFQSKYAIDGYDKNGFLKYSQPVSLEFEGQKFHFETLIGLQNNLLLFAYTYNKDKDLNILIASVLSPEGKVIKDFQVIDEISAPKRRNSGGFNVQLTDDSTKVLVYRVEPYDHEGLEKVHFTLLDENLNKIWTKPLELPVKDKESQLKDYAVDNEGRVFIVAKKVERKAKSDVPPVYLIYGYLPEEDRMTEMELTLPDKYLSDPSILFDRAGELLISGFYKSDWRKGINGQFYMRMNPKTQEIITRNYKDFGKDLLVEFYGEKQGAKADKKERGLYNYVLRNIIRRSDGGIVLVAERYYMYISCTTDSQGRQTCNYHYVYGNLLVANINNLGEVEWYARIPKNQHTVNDGGYYSSFMLAVKSDKLCFIFNDNPKNLTEKYANRTKQVKVMKKSMVALYELDGEGKLTKAPLITNKGQQVILRPKVSIQNSSRSLTALGERGKKFNLVRIEFND